MREEIGHDIYSFIYNFIEKDGRISKFIKPYQIKILSFYYRDFKDDELKISKVFWLKNNNGLNGFKLREYIKDHMQLSLRNIILYLLFLEMKYKRH